MRMMTLAAVFTLLASPAFASTKWTPDYQKSTLQFVGKYGQNTVTTNFVKFTADVAFDPAKLDASKVTVTVDMKSTKTATAPQAEFAQPVDADLPLKGWFDVASFATAKFETATIIAKGGNAYEATGKLTLVGVTKDIVLPFTVDITGNSAVAKGKITLNRIDFGIKGNSPLYSLPKPVPHAVDVLFTLTATK